MNKKLQARIRRAKKTRAKIRELGCHRLCVNRSLNHIYAQVISPEGKVIAAAASVEKSLHDVISKAEGKINVAKEVGKVVAKRAIDQGVTSVAFDRSGLKYHGRVKALADGAREAELKF